MRKILALLLSLVLLLGTCAVAEEAAPVAHSYALSGVSLTYGDLNLDLSNVKLELDVVDDGAMLLHLDADGESAAEIGFTKVGDMYVLHMDGALMEHKDFAMDPVVYMERSLQGGIDGLIEMLQGVDVHATAEKLVDLFENAAPAAEEAAAAAGEAEAAEIAPEPTPEITVEGDIVSAMLDCVTGPVDATLDGSTSIPAGDYEMTSLYMDQETMASLLDMVRVNGEASGFGDALRESGVEASLSVALYEGENGVDASNSTLSFAMNGEAYELDLVTVHTVADAGESTAVEISVGMNGELATLKFTVSEGEHEGEVFTADSVDMDSAVVISDMSDEEAEVVLADAFTELRGDAMLPIAAPLMEVLMANVDLTALEAELAEAGMAEEVVEETAE